jgi:hypothetical protein
MVQLRYAFIRLMSGIHLRHEAVRRKPKSQILTGPEQPKDTKEN